MSRHAKDRGGHRARFGAVEDWVGLGCGVVAVAAFVLAASLARYGWWL